MILATTRSVLTSAICASAAFVVSACSGAADPGSGTDPSLHAPARPQARKVVTIAQDMSVVPPRAQQALDLDPLGLFTGIPMDQRMNVGLRVALSLSAPGATTITDVQWSVPATAIAGYDLEAAVDMGQGYLTSCATTALAPADLQQQDIAFYFTQVGDEVIGVSAVVDGTTMTASRTFAVRRHPKAEIFYVVGPGSASTLTDLTGDGMVDNDDFLLYQETFGHDADPSGTVGFGNIGEHNAWHQLIPSQTVGDEFFRFHRGFGQKADCWRGIFGYPCTQVYATAPGYVPTGNDVDHSGVGAGGVCDQGTGVGDGNGIVALSRDTTGHPNIEELPAQLTLAGDGSVALGDFATGNDLVLAVIDYHDRQHGHLSMTGDLLDDCTSPADPLYWRFHLMLTRLYELWQFLKLDDGTVQLAAVECAGPDGAQAFFPDPDARVEPGCANPVAFACNPPSGSVFPLGTTTVTCTVSDVMLLDPGFTGMNPGMTRTVSFDVTVVDTTAPTITCIEDVTVECEQPGGAVVTFDVTATDVCDQAPTIVSTPPSGSTFPLGTTMVESVATDASGNSTSCTFEVVVADTVAPVITCLDDITVECDQPGGAVVSFEVTATDACDEAPTVVSDPPPGSTFALGTTVVESVATDASGNSTSCTFEVTVTDTTAPVIACQEDITAECDQSGGAVVTFEVTATDACDEAPTVISDPPSGSTFPVGTTVVESVATDAAGNSSSCTFNVTVSDTTAPILVLDPEPAVLWPPNHAYESVHVEDFVLDVSDLCDGELGSESVSIVMVTSDEAQDARGSGNTTDDIVISSDCRSVDLRRERAGPGNGRVYNIVVSVSDGAGNSTTGTYQVMVPHDKGKRGTAVDDGAAYSVGCGS